MLLQPILLAPCQPMRVHAANRQSMILTLIPPTAILPCQSMMVVGRISLPQPLHSSPLVTYRRAVYPKNYALCCLVLWIGTGLFYPYSSGLLHSQWASHMIAPLPAKQYWRIWPKNNRNLFMTNAILTIKQICHIMYVVYDLLFNGENCQYISMV